MASYAKEKKERKIRTEKLRKGYHSQWMQYYTANLRMQEKIMTPSAKALLLEEDYSE